MKFGTSKYVCGLAWDTIAQSEYDLSEDKLELKDLLKCMHFLRVYSTEENLCDLFNVNEKTFRIRYKRALKALAWLPLICWQSRHVQENSSH